MEPHSALYEAVFRRTRHAMTIVDDDGILHDFNRALVALVGWSREDALGRDRREYTVPEDRPLVDEQQEALRRDLGWVGTYRSRSHVGPPIAMEVAADPNVSPGRHLVLYTPLHGSEGRAVVRREAIPAARTRQGPEPTLTARERDVVTELALGATGAEIAETLHITVDTVRTHIRNAMARTGARTRTHLAVVALRWELIDPDARPAREA